MSAKFLWGVVSFPKEGTRIMVIYLYKKKNCLYKFSENVQRFFLNRLYK